MPTPDGLTTTTIHGKYVQPNLAGTPLQGTLTFNPNPTVVTFPAENVIIAGTETATLDENGEFTLELVSTDQAGENPTGWTYSVSEKLNGQRNRSYIISLPYNGGEVVELSDITPTEAAPNYLPVVGPQGAPGIVTTVNGYSAATINLVAADVDAVALEAVGAANGVASLDPSALVPIAQLPDLSSDYVGTARIGAASGVAELDPMGLVIPTQLDLSIATPGDIADTGSVGTATALARADHTHAGVALTGNQSPAGDKTWTGSAFFTGPGVGVGVSSGLSARVDFRTGSAGQTVLNLQNTSGASTAAILKLNGDTTNTALMVSLVTGDAQNRFALRGSGQLEFGDGTNARDVSFYRSAAGILNSTGQLASDSAAPTAASHLTRKDYVDTQLSNTTALAVHLAGTETVTGLKNFTGGVGLIGASSTAITHAAYVTGDTANRFAVHADGKIEWGTGAGALDTNLYRSAANTLKTDDDFTANNLSVVIDWTTPALFTGYTGNGNNNGTVQYRVINFLGTKFVQWRGGLNVTYSGSSPVNGGNFLNAVLPASAIPSGTRSTSVACSASASTSLSVKIDFVSDGTTAIVVQTGVTPPWLSLNDVIYPI